ncbi:NosD domain-containing protein [Knoellia koreensis]|uniref:Right-handed parallel beta-helix repeat-containing protein n=1 Tax=Knoellia koreensis TaxID=2730921 RepID=A0A849HK11_9MICO|nr:right-handed parallel beta-helix repeat-containing protein [Knoellia sp. DB2414S]
MRLLAASLATATAVVVLPSVDQRLADTASARPLGPTSTTTKITWKRSGTATSPTTTTPSAPVPTTPTPSTPPPTTTVPATPTSIPTSATQTLTQSSAPPAGALFVATNGADTNPGTAAQPLATLAKALTRAQAGQTVVVRGGVYRQGIAGPVDTSLGTTWSTPAANVTIQGYPGETAWFDGTDAVSGWRADSSTRWSAPWSTPTFCGGRYYEKAVFTAQTMAGPCSHPDMLVPGTATGSPQMLFRNGVQLTEVDAASKVTANTFFYDHGARRLVVGADPAGQTMQAAKRAQALAIYNTTGLTIKNIGFRRYGSNEFTNATSGAVALNKVTGAVLDGVAFTQNAGGGLLGWQAKKLTVRHSFLSLNGFDGMLANGSRREALANPSAGIRDDVLVENSRLDGNNTDGFGPNCAASCASAGAKFTQMVGFTLRDNSFSHNGGNKAAGFWCDLACTEGRIYNNAFVSNAAEGLFYEVSDRGTIASNVMVGNGFAVKGSGLMVSAANTRIYNNTIAGNYNNVLIYDDTRVPGAQVGPDTANVVFANNVVTRGASGRPQVTFRAAQTKPSAFMKFFDYNTYHRPSGTATWWLNWEETAYVNGLYDYPAQLAKARSPLSTHDTYSTVSTDPYFVSASTSDYRLQSTSVAGASVALPSDIATMLHVSPTGAGRGALLPAEAATAAQPIVR